MDLEKILEKCNQFPHLRDHIAAWKLSATKTLISKGHPTVEVCSQKCTSQTDANLTIINFCWSINSSKLLKKNLMIFLNLLLHMSMFAFLHKISVCFRNIKEIDAFNSFNENMIFCRCQSLSYLSKSAFIIIDYNCWLWPWNWIWWKLKLGIWKQTSFAYQINWSSDWNAVIV